MLIRQCLHRMRHELHSSNERNLLPNQWYYDCCRMSFWMFHLQLNGKLHHLSSTQRTLLRSCQQHRQLYGLCHHWFPDLHHLLLRIHPLNRSKVMHLHRVKLPINEQWHLLKMQLFLRTSQQLLHTLHDLTRLQGVFSLISDNLPILHGWILSRRRKMQDVPCLLLWMQQRIHLR